MDEEVQKYWEEFVIKHLGEFEPESFKLKEGDAEKYVLSLLNNIDESDIVDGKINEENLQKYNAANILALIIFKNIKSFEIDKLKDNLSFAQTYLTIEDFTIEDIENVKANNKKIFLEFIKTVDHFNITAGNNRELYVTFTVNNVYEGELRVIPFAVLITDENNFEYEKFPTLETANEYAKNYWDSLTDKKKKNTSVKTISNVQKYEGENGETVDGGIEYEMPKDGYTSENN